MDGGGIEVTDVTKLHGGGDVSVAALNGVGFEIGVGE